MAFLKRAPEDVKDERDTREPVLGLGGKADLKPIIVSKCPFCLLVNNFPFNSAVKIP